jgi:hypothetical protein
MGRMGGRVKDWVSLGLQVVLVIGLGWLCWRLVKLRRFYRAALADLMAEDGAKEDG